MDICFMIFNNWDTIVFTSAGIIFAVTLIKYGFGKA